MTLAKDEALADVESIKEILVTYATGGIEQDEEYRRLRGNLVKDNRLKSRLPPLVLSSRNLKEFWRLISTRFPTYAERREHLRQEFEPILVWLEDGLTTPIDNVISVTLSNISSDHIQEAWKKTLDRKTDDPEGAITAARTLLEAVCKYILDESGIAYDEHTDLPQLYSKVAEQINLAPSQQTEKIFKQILGGCQAVVEGLGSMRNRLGDAHGKGRVAIKPAPRHAELAVNLAGSMATFLIATWEVRKKNTEHH